MVNPVFIPRIHNLLKKYNKGKIPVSEYLRYTQ